MAAGIQVSPGKTWSTQNYIFRRLMEDVRSRSREDPTVSEQVNAAFVIMFITLDEHNDVLRRLGPMIYAAAKEVVGAVPSGADAGNQLPEPLQMNYVRGLADLVKSSRRTAVLRSSSDLRGFEILEQL